MSFQTFTADHGNIRLVGDRIGPASGVPLLLIAGIAAERLFWHDDFCRALVENGFQVARFDNRDSGQSTHLRGASTPGGRRARRRPETAPYRLEDMADDAVAVMDALGWTTTHVAGHSVGGMIAQLLAIHQPRRISSLTSISSSPSAVIGHVTPMTILRFLLANPAEFLGRPPKGPDEAADRLIRGHRIIGSPAYPLDEQWLRHIVEVREIRGHDPTARARHEAAGGATGDLQGALDELDVPALVIHGQADKFVRPEGGVATAAAIADATLALMEGMGHDMPRGLWPEIIRHIKAIAAQGRARIRSSESPAQGHVEQNRAP